MTIAEKKRGLTGKNRITATILSAVGLSKSGSRAEGWRMGEMARM